jgi:mannose-6-phosphate isomerase-like protein (cupin superfamily)
VVHSGQILGQLGLLSRDDAGSVSALTDSLLVQFRNAILLGVALLLEHGTMQLRWFAPKGEDTQTPHDQDELYIIASGTGWFRRGTERVPFAAHDALFVRAGEAHRFEDFSADFATWVVFYGAKGGEG